MICDPKFELMDVYSDLIHLEKELRSILQAKVEDFHILNQVHWRPCLEFALIWKIELLPLRIF